MTGVCKLKLTLAEIAEVIPTVYTESMSAMYGFHAKYSSDGRLILFVVRTIHLLPLQWYSISWPWWTTGKKMRIQHAVVLRSKGTKPVYITSWGNTNKWNRVSRSRSRSTIPLGIGGQESKVMTTRAALGRDLELMDGNHPSWVPRVYPFSKDHRRKICATYSDQRTLHVPARVSAAGPRGPGSVPPGSLPTPTCPTQDFDLSQCLLYGISMNRAASPNSKSYSLAVFSILLCNHMNHSTPHLPTPPDSHIQVYSPTAPVYSRGTGHPSFHRSGRFAVTDGYLKESHLYADRRGPSGHVPIVLLDVLSGNETLLLQVS